MIPARGGSKRLERKNLRLLDDLPLIAHTIRAAAQATRLTDWLVSSEDPEILEVARAHGAPTPFVRPPELAGDKVRNIETMRHALEFMEDQTGQLYDIVLLLQPTSPIRDPAHIDQAVELLWASPLDTLASVKGPYRKRDSILKRIDEEGVLADYRTDGKPREPFYIYNAALYAAKREYFLREQKLVSERQVPLPMDALHSIDVDTETDLVIAEACIRHMKERKGQ